MARAGLGPSLLFLKAAAVLLPRFLTWSLTLPVLQARTTLAMPTFPPTQARSLLSCNSCLLISKPSAPFSTALPAHRDTGDPRVGLSTFLLAPAHSCTPPGPSVSRAPAGHSHLGGAFALHSGRSQHLPSPQISPAAPPLAPGQGTTIPSHTPPAD